MVDSVDKLGAGGRAIAPVSKTNRLAPVAATTAPEPGVTAQVGATSLAKAMAAAPPIDQERVARIRKAIADGTFPILPAKAADRLLALKLQWNPHDAA